MPNVSHYNSIDFWVTHTQDIESICYKHTETIEYVKK